MLLLLLLLLLCYMLFEYIYKNVCSKSAFGYIHYPIGYAYLHNRFANSLILLSSLHYVYIYTYIYVREVEQECRGVQICLKVERLRDLKLTTGGQGRAPSNSERHLTMASHPLGAAVNKTAAVCGE